MIFRKTAFHPQINSKGKLFRIIRRVGRFRGV
jgi:hypothetical protein